MGRYSQIREITPSNSGNWSEVNRTLDDHNIGHVTLWDEDRGKSLAIFEFDNGTKMATLVVRSVGISRQSHGELWEPMLPIVDVVPLDPGQQG